MIKAMKSVSGTLKVDMAQFRDLEAFATFGSELDAVSAAQLGRGYRLVELLKQPLNSPMPVAEQVISIYCGTNGILDDLPVEQVRDFEAELLETFRTRHADLLGTIRDSGALPDEEKLAQAVADFKAQFIATRAPEDGAPADVSAIDAEALGDAESQKTLETE
jgi:F-type H+-transporting ATPase subunit alpha